MGAGAGLYIVKAIVEAHDGPISVESELGGGSTFYVFISQSFRHARCLKSPMQRVNGEYEFLMAAVSAVRGLESQGLSIQNAGANGEISQHVC